VHIIKDGGLACAMPLPDIAAMNASRLSYPGICAGKHGISTGQTAEASCTQHGLLDPVRDENQFFSKKKGMLTWEQSRQIWCED
jgi:hypothetical protein